MTDEQKVREAVSVPPRWYSLSEIEHCLERMNYSPAVIAELAPWFFRHIHAAFNKGYQKAQDKQAALSHASATAEEGSVAGEAVGIGVDQTSDGVWIAVRLGDRLVYNNFHGLRTPDCCHPPRSAEDARDAEIARLNAIINTPQADDFLRAVSTEAEHQRQRWGTSHDSGKEPSDWFWLIGYLAGKALHAHTSGNTEKAEHHIITTAAACANWHRSIFGRTDMRPGIDGDQAISAKVDR